MGERCCQLYIGEGDNFVVAFRGQPKHFLAGDMKQIVCNYAVARFLPYRESAEFVNVGVVLICPQLGYFDFLFEKRKHRRVADFFPELDLEVFKGGLQTFIVELERLKTAETNETPAQFVLADEIKSAQERFRELVRPRETLLHFGEVGTLLATDPSVKLKELFAFYIKRQFAHDREYQEIIMRNKLADFLKNHQLDRFYKSGQVGDDSYHVVLPFIHEQQGKIVKAIKPLHLDKEGPTEIYRYGDSWISTIRRLRSANRLPSEFMFTVKSPKTNHKRIAAAREICQGLEEFDAITAAFGEGSRILDFARI